MEEKKFDIEEIDGVVVYDESDDYDPGESEETSSEGGYKLPENEEIFTEEYMRDFAEKMDAKIAKEKRIDKIISVSIIGILAAVAVITGIIIYNVAH